MPSREISPFYFSTFQQLHLLINIQIRDKDWCVRNVTKKWFTRSNIWQNGDLTLCSMHTWGCSFSGASSKCHGVLFNQLNLPLSVLALSNYLSFISGKLWDCCFAKARAVGEWFCVGQLWWRLGPGNRANRGQDYNFFFSPTRVFSEMSLLKAHTSVCWLQQDYVQT